MSVIVVPGDWVGVPHPAGRLASTLVSVAVAGLADPTRFRRGREYAADGAVTRLEVDHGVVRAEVMGSRDMPYDVVVRVGTLDVPVADTADALRLLMPRLAPDVDDISTYCTCPDWDGVCKHAVAALVALAGHLVERPDLLVLWRSAGTGAEPSDASGTPAAAPRTRPTTAPPHTVSPAPSPPDPWASPDWAAFLGGTPPPVDGLPTDPIRVRSIAFGSADLGDVVRSALAELRRSD